MGYYKHIYFYIIHHENKLGYYYRVIGFRAIIDFQI